MWEGEGKGGQGEYVHHAKQYIHYLSSLRSNSISPTETNNQKQRRLDKAREEKNN